MRRIIFGALGLYLLAAIATRAAEAAGTRECGCTSDCWCKKPGLALFRWVAPFKHRSLDPEVKRALAERAAAPTA